ncbi:MAG TPA: hypothetical protein VI455_16840 [Terriglobia bacterium]
MALDELHERRLATLINVFEDALDRIELLLATAERGQTADAGPPPSLATISEIRGAAAHTRRHLQAATARFAIKRTRPGWNQRIAGELSTLWVVLENSLPRRMKGYGREFAPQDRDDWESMIQELLSDVEQMRGHALPTNNHL